MALFYYRIFGYIRAGDEHEAKGYLDDLMKDNEKIPESWSPIKHKMIAVEEIDEETVQL
jgi:hypothetical protein